MIGSSIRSCLIDLTHIPLPPYYYCYNQEESSGWVERTILVASVTEDADAITEMHEAVLGKRVYYAVDGPDGEHDLEDLVCEVLLVHVLIFHRIIIR